MPIINLRKIKVYVRFPLKIKMGCSSKIPLKKTASYYNNKLQRHFPNEIIGNF